MAVEPYDPCPCGSDKKFKFCCQPISEELGAIERLAADEQPKQVLIAVEKIPAAHATNRIVLRNSFRAHLALGQLEAARDVAQSYMVAHPEDAIANYFNVKWHLLCTGWAGARPHIERDLYKILSQHPRLARELAAIAFQLLMNGGLYMAARRYLLDVVTWSTSQEEFDESLGILHKVNASVDVPFPFRCNYTLQALPEGQPNQQEFAEAFAFAEARNFTTAAQLFEALVAKDPHQPVLCRNAGLCYAWSGDLVAASEMLGQAADDLPDFDSAVNLETLAQLLEMELPDQQVPLRLLRYRVTGVGKLLTLLNKCPRLIPQEIPENVLEQSKRVVGIYAVLNREIPAAAIVDVRLLPRILAHILVLDEDADKTEPAELQINGRSPLFGDADRDFILQLAEGLVDVTPAEHFGELPASNFVAKDRAAVNFECVFGQGLKQSEVLKVRHAFSDYTSYELWPQTPLSALDDISPQKAARNPESHLPVCAAINVLATFGDEFGYSVDVGRLRQQLGLPAIQPCVVPEAKNIISLPGTDAIRLPFEELVPEALVNAFSVVGSANQTIPFRRCLNVMWDKKVFPPELPLPQFCQIAHAQAMKLRDLDEAVVWIQRGRDSITDDKDKLQWRIQFDFDELLICALTGNITRLTELLRTFARDYFTPMPAVRNQVWQVLESERIDTREIMSIMNGTDFSLVGAGAGTTTPAGVWTPGSEEAAPSGGGKLWVPGQ